MVNAIEPNAYHALAKDAGNKLKGYIIAYSSGATGVFFLALTDAKTSFSAFEKVSLICAILFFVATTVICLCELHIDARRFFNVAKQLERPQAEQVWDRNERYKVLRVRLIYASYITLGIATLAAVLFLVARVA